MLDFFLTLIVIVLSGLVGYVFGVAQAFRAQKQKAYSDILPPILKFAYDKKCEQDEREFNKSLSILWLYASKAVTRKMEQAISIMHHPDRGNLTEALQKAIIEMRKDIQICPWQMLDSKNVNHLYTKIVNKLPSEADK